MAMGSESWFGYGDGKDSIRLRSASKSLALDYLGTGRREFMDG